MLGECSKGRQGGQGVGKEGESEGMSQGDHGVTWASCGSTEPWSLPTRRKQGWEEERAREQEGEWQRGGRKARQGGAQEAREGVFKEMGAGGLTLWTAATRPGDRKTEDDLPEQWGVV